MARIQHRSKQLGFWLCYCIAGGLQANLQADAEWARIELPTETPTVEYRDSTLKTDSSYPLLKTSTLDGSFSTFLEHPSQETFVENVAEQSTPDNNRVRRSPSGFLRAVVISLALALVSVSALDFFSKKKGADPQADRLAAVKGLLPDAERLANALDTGEAKQLLRSAQQELAAAESVVMGFDRMAFLEGAGVKFERCVGNALKALSMLHDATWVKCSGILRAVTPLGPVTAWASSAVALAPKNDFVHACKVSLKALEDLSTTMYHRAAAALEEMPKQGAFTDENDGRFLQLASVHLEYLEELQASRHRLGTAAQKLKHNMLLAAKASYVVERKDRKRRREYEIQVIGQLALALSEERRRKDPTLDVQGEIDQTGDLLYELMNLSIQHSELIASMEATDQLEAVLHLNSQAIVVENKVERIVQTLRTTTKGLEQVREVFDKGSHRLEKTLLESIKREVEDGEAERTAIRKLGERLDLKVREEFGNPKAISDDRYFIPTENVSRLVREMESLQEAADLALKDIDKYNKSITKKLLRIGSPDAAQDLVDAETGVENALKKCIALIGLRKEADILLFEFELLKFLEGDMAASFDAISRAKMHVFAEGSRGWQAVYDIKAAFSNQIQSAKKSRSLKELAEVARDMRNNAERVQQLVYSGKSLAARSLGKPVE